MTRILWVWIKDKLIHPYVKLDIKDFDLGMEYRDKVPPFFVGFYSVIMDSLHVIPF